ncbi:hypothetical protein BJ165DRAFT_1407843 [Panaeolus papilionaceus]|nr:hypothetical protein BJ165DRAFT_1407843 [Panaeolus papilionaceus]
MFFRNDTAQFIKAKLTEEEDHKFIQGAARELWGQERIRRQELVDFRDQKQAQKAERRAKRQAAAEEAAARLSNTPLVLKYRKAKLLAGVALQDQVKLFRSLGAPNLVGKALPTIAKEKRLVLRKAIRLYKLRLWIIGDDDAPSDE